MKACLVKDCAAPYYSRGFCKKHYDKNRRHGDPLFEEKFAKDVPCIKPGCTNLQRTKGLCNNHYAIFRRENDPEIMRKHLEGTIKWRANNPKALARNQALYRERHKKQLADYFVQWRTENKENYNAYQASRKKRVKAAIPKWADLKAIELFYRNCPKGFHVDHIIPIKGKEVCGLHVIDNLQYLSALENLKKGNRIGQ